MAGGNASGGSDGSGTSPILQGSFTSGELAPALYARTDLSKFHSGAKLLRNFFIQAQGGAINRAGTRYVGLSVAGDAPIRLIPFSFNTEQTYALVLTGGQIQLVSDAGFVTVDGTLTGARVTITAPYLGADLFDITYCQSADVLTLTHSSYPPAQIIRNSASSWTYSVIGTGSGLATPTLTTVAAHNSGHPDMNTNVNVLTVPFRYAITAVSSKNADESPLSGSGSCSNYDLSFSNYGVFNEVAWNAIYDPNVSHVNVYRYFQGVWAFCAATQGTPREGNIFIWDDQDVTPDTNTTPPQTVDPFHSAVFNGSISGTHLIVSTIGYGSMALDQVIAGPGVAPGTQISAVPARVTFEGSCAGTVLTVSGAVTGGTLSIGQNIIGADMPITSTIVSLGTGTGDTGTYNLNQPSTTPAGNSDYPTNEFVAITNGVGTYTVNISQTVSAGQLVGDPNYPAASAYFQQRAIYGGTIPAPQEVFTSKSANYTNFNVSQPLRDDDAITLTIAANQVNSIRHFVSVNDLIVFTNGGAWKLSGQSNSGDVITPANVVCTPQAYSGCSNVPPIVVSPNILYVQEKGNTVRDLSYNVYSNLYTGNDISLLSAHLFYGYQIIDWCFAREPWKVIWATRNDGVMLGCTYLREQEVYAWHHHDTGPTVDAAGAIYPATFVSVCSISEGAEDVVYLAVRRFLNGAWTRTIERMQSRILGMGDADVTASWFVDCGLQYSGAPAKTITGLDHLDGQMVAILADGAAKPQQVVAAGTITLDTAASIVTVGLPIQAQMETLPLDAGEPTQQGKYKRLTKTRVYVYRTRGLKVGSDSPTGPLLEEIKPRHVEPWGSPPALFTGQQLIHPPGVWDPYGSMWVQQDYPLPACIIGIEPWMALGA